MTRDAPRLPISMLLSYAFPTLGMEKAAFALAQQLAEDREVTITVMRGRAPDIPGILGVSLAPSATRRSYLRPFLALSRWRPATDCRLVVVGAWAAIPWLVLNMVKRVHTVVWEHSLARETLGGSARRRLLFRLARRLYRTAGLVVAVSEPLASDLRVAGGPRVIVIPNPVMPRSFVPTTRNDGGGDRGIVRVLCVGSHTANKRYEVAVRLAERLPNVRVDLAGSGPRTDELQQLAVALEVTDRVSLHGHLPVEELNALYRQADVLLHPSAGETFGMVFIEAAEHGVPVLANENRVARQMVPTYAPGMLFDGSVDGAADAVASGSYRCAPAQFRDAAARRRAAFSPERVGAMWDAAL